MAADTPVLIGEAETGVRLDARFQCLKNPYSGAGTQREVRWQLSLTNSFPASGSNLKFDTLLREPDNQDLGADWADVHGAQIPLASSTVYYRSCMVRNTSNQSSALSVWFARAIALETA